MELKPCPFCGGNPFVRSYDRLKVIGCDACKYNIVRPDDTCPHGERRGDDGI